MKYPSKNKNLKLIDSNWNVKMIWCHRMASVICKVAFFCQMARSNHIRCIKKTWLFSFFITYTYYNIGNKVGIDTYKGNKKGGELKFYWITNQATYWRGYIYNKVLQHCDDEQRSSYFLVHAFSRFHWVLKYYKCQNHKRVHP